MITAQKQNPRPQPTQLLSCLASVKQLLKYRINILPPFPMVQFQELLGWRHACVDDFSYCIQKPGFLIASSFQTSLHQVQNILSNMLEQTVSKWCIQATFRNLIAKHLSFSHSPICCHVQNTL
nr:hypothetical protein Iba_chr04dCG19120 [Ipomoea batatas]